MKQKQLVAAYKAIESIKGRNEPINAQAAWILFQIRKATTSAFEFQVEEEQGIFQNNPPKAIGNGVFEFDTPEIAAEVKKKLKDLGDMEVGFEMEPFVLQAMEAPNLTIEEMEALDGFLIIENGEFSAPALRVLPNEE